MELFIVKLAVAVFPLAILVAAGTILAPVSPRHAYRPAAGHSRHRHHRLAPASWDADTKSTR